MNMSINVSSADIVHPADIVYSVDEANVIPELTSVNTGARMEVQEPELLLQSERRRGTEKHHHADLQ